MKIQCACGAKYAFEVMPEQATQPVRFVCPACGLDSSEHVTRLIQEQFGRGGSAPPTEIAPPPGVTTSTATESVGPSQPHTSPVPQVRLRRSEPVTEDTTGAAAASEFCRKHPGVRTLDKCVVCQKPICPKCMEVLGYVCSPLCRQKAEFQGIDVPIYAGQKALVEARQWRKVVWGAGSLGAALAVLVGAWIWYKGFASRPGVAFSLRFEQRAYSGAAFLGGADQIVFLHGGTLARHDLKSKQQIWSTDLIDQQAIHRAVEEELKQLHAAQARLDLEHPDADPIRIPPPDKLAAAAERSAAARLHLHLAGSNIWVSSPGKLARYDWESGKPVKKLSLSERFGQLFFRGDEFLAFDRGAAKEIVTHVDLRTGTIREETIPLTEQAAGELAAGAPAQSAATRTSPAVGLPGAPGRDGSQAMDPARVQEQFSQLTLAQRLAAPAVLSVNRSQERALAEMNGTSGGHRAAPAIPTSEQSDLIPGATGYYQFSVRLIEQRLVERKVMKAPPKKSALDGAVTAASGAAVANEIMNEIQRERGGDTVVEDESRYQVTLRRADGKGETWSAELTGPPSLHPLRTVNVLAANQRIIVLNSNNQKLWESALTYNVVGRDRDESEASTGEGPCVERGDSLFVFDQGVLTAFDLKNGSARWRLPSVGISALFFDEAGMMYVNSTTAGPDTIKYSKQIDVTSPTSGLILKIDPRNGKMLWSRETRGGIRYLSGKFIYAMESYQADEDEDGERPRLQIGLETESYVRLRRINPANGRDYWTYYEPRAPVNVSFDRNVINLVFKKEVQVLKYFSF